MKVSKQLAIELLKNKSLRDNARIMCRGFANDYGDWVEVCHDDVDSLDGYNDFEIWFNNDIYI